MAKIKKERNNKSKSTKIKPKLTRKEQRKQRILEKKENKRIFFSRKVDSNKCPENLVKKPHLLSEQKPKSSKKSLTKTATAPLDIEKLLSNQVQDDDESIASDFEDDEIDARLQIAKLNSKQNTQPVSKRAKVQSTRPNLEEQHRRELQRQHDLEKASRKQRIKQLHMQNEEDDIEIARLEKKLKLNRSKDKNRLVRKMFNDGLDYALEICLDDEEERAKLELKEKRKKAQEGDGDWSDESDIENEARDETHTMETDNSNDGNTDEDDGEDDGGDDDDDDLESTVEHDKSLATTSEDIYGRKRDKDGNIIKDEVAQDDAAVPQKYMPPHVRAKLLAAQENGDDNEQIKQAQLLERIRKQCKGLLNRLSQANLHKIAAGIEELYMRNSRYNMNETLTKLLNEALITRSMTKDRMVQEHIVLVAYLHAHIGNEIGAHFLQSYVEQFNAFLNDDIQNLPIEDKRLNNIVLLLSYMYIFKIFEHRLLVEIIDKLTQYLCEKTIECLLLIFQSVGFKLRKDDPVAFKQMTNTVQQRIAAAPLELKENLRLKFMVDTLNAVKNNNSKKIPQFDPELGENLRKALKAMLRNDKYVTTLNITLDDLLRADQVGKWWVVGSAWSGKIDDLGAAHKQQGDTTAGVKKFSERLLKLAKQQKMNTEERRSIFCIVMSAADYMDAFEQILHLALKDQRDIAYVIIRCCLNEARPNPYYAHLATKFCNHNRKFQLAFNFASWDCINEIEALNKQQIKNFGQFLQNLILSGGVQLTVLKVVDFVQLQKSSFLLMREVIVGLLLHKNEKELFVVFERVAKNNKVHQFKNSLRLFMQHFLLKQEATKLKLTEENLTLLTKRIDYLDNLLAQIDL